VISGGGGLGGGGLGGGGLGLGGCGLGGGGLGLGGGGIGGGGGEGARTVVMATVSKTLSYLRVTSLVVSHELEAHILT
jgi:hypothetical protein